MDKEERWRRLDDRKRMKKPPLRAIAYALFLSICGAVLIASSFLLLTGSSSHWWEREWGFGLDFSMFFVPFLEMLSSLSFSRAY
jgi:hypothetical protein